MSSLSPLTPLLIGPSSVFAQGPDIAVAVLFVVPLQGFFGAIFEALVQFFFDAIVMGTVELISSLFVGTTSWLLFFTPPLSVPGLRSLYSDVFFLYFTFLSIGGMVYFIALQAFPNNPQLEPTRMGRRVLVSMLIIVAAPVGFNYTVILHNAMGRYIMPSEVGFSAMGGALETIATGVTAGAAIAFILLGGIPLLFTVLAYFVALALRTVMIYSVFIMIPIIAGAWAFDIGPMKYVQGVMELLVKLTVALLLLGLLIPAVLATGNAIANPSAIQGGAPVDGGVESPSTQNPWLPEELGPGAYDQQRRATGGSAGGSADGQFASASGGGGIPTNAIRTLIFWIGTQWVVVGLTLKVTGFVTGINLKGKAQRAASKTRGRRQQEIGSVASSGAPSLRGDDDSSSVTRDGSSIAVETDEGGFTVDEEDVNEWEFDQDEMGGMDDATVGSEWANSAQDYLSDTKVGSAVGRAGSYVMGTRDDGTGIGQSEVDPESGETAEAAIHGKMGVGAGRLAKGAGTVFRQSGWRNSVDATRELNSRRSSSPLAATKSKLRGMGSSAVSKARGLAGTNVSEGEDGQGDVADMETEPTVGRQETVPETRAEDMDTQPATEQMETEPTDQTGRDGMDTEPATENMDTGPATRDMETEPTPRDMETERGNESTQGRSQAGGGRSSGQDSRLSPTNRDRTIEGKPDVESLSPTGGRRSQGGTGGTAGSPEGSRSQQSGSRSGSGGPRRQSESGGAERKQSQSPNRSGQQPPAPHPSEMRPVEPDVRDVDNDDAGTLGREDNE